MSGLRNDNQLLWTFGTNRRRLDESSSFVNVPLLSSSNAAAYAYYNKAGATGYGGKDLDYDELQMLKMGKSGNTHTKRWLWLGALILCLAAIFGIMTLGAIQASHAKDTVGYNPDLKVDGDPSSFTKDAALKKSFAGMCCACSA